MKKYSIFIRKDENDGFAFLKFSVFFSHDIAKYDKKD